MSASVASRIFTVTVVSSGIALASAACAYQAGSPPPPAPAARGASSPSNAPVALDQAKIEKGRGLFSDYSCGTCHTLADADATGHVGPALDGNANVSEDFVKERVTNGQGPMPAFGGQMTPEEIATISYYVSHVAKK